jgi:phospholipid transport system substrate-binding protein
MSSFIRRRSLPRLAAAATTIALIGPGLVTMMSAQAAAADQDPTAQLVQRTADRVIEVARTSTGAARESGMMRLLQAEFDLTYMGRSTLGTHWDQATPEQRQRFLKVIASAEAHSYAQRFGQYAGQTLTVSRVNPRGNGVSLVDSQLKQSNGEPVAIQWEVRNDGQRPRIVDVKAEGVSMVLTRRSEYNSYIRSHGGTVEPLISELEARAKQ